VKRKAPNERKIKRKTSASTAVYIFPPIPISSSLGENKGIEDITQIFQQCNVLFSKTLSQTATSQGYFAKWPLPKSAISQAATS